MERIVWFPTDKADGLAVPKERVVRCSDCRYFIAERGLCEHRKPYVFPVARDGFCSHGKEREK